MAFDQQAAPPYHNPNNGYIIPQPPDDTVSRLRFSPGNAPSPCLLAASWNGSARLWRLDSAAGPATGIAEVMHANPILDAAWSADGHAVYFASLDNLVTRWDLHANSQTVVAKHDAPVRGVADNSAVGFLATAGWDRTLRYWDARAPSGVAQAVIPLTERCYAMDSVGYLMVLALAARRLAVFDVRKPTTPFQERYTQLRHQSRCIAAWPDSMGFVIGGVDGSVSVDYVQAHRQVDNAVFSCHRDKGGPFCINAVRFNRATGAFATAASDGHVFFWDKDRLNRARAKRFERMNAPVCDVDFFHDGSMYAYAVGYDWSKGADGNTMGPDKNCIVLQSIDDGDITPHPNTNNHNNNNTHHNHNSNNNYSSRGRGGHARGARRRGYPRRAG